MDITTLQEFIEQETEALDNIYYGENVVAEQPEIIQVPKHELDSKLVEESKILKAAAALNGTAPLNGQAKSDANNN